MDAAEPVDYDLAVNEMHALWQSLHRDQAVRVLDTLPLMDAVIVSHRLMAKLVDIDQRLYLMLLGERAAHNRHAASQSHNFLHPAEPREAKGRASRPPKESPGPNP